MLPLCAMRGPWPAPQPAVGLFLSVDRDVLGDEPVYGLVVEAGLAQDLPAMLT